MRLGSLCSGAGGLDLAVATVFGATTAWHCELDPAASKVLAHRWPGVPNHGDLIATDWSTVDPVDIICAGWPCQPFSLAGKRKGADDDRAIWPHIARAIRVLRPRIVCLENVPAVLVSEFGRVADSLGALGYDLRWTCLRASDVGAPHRRERLFVVAYADSGRFQVGTQRNGHSAQSKLAAPLGRDVGGCDHNTATDCGGYRIGRDADAGPDIDLLPTPSAGNFNDGEDTAKWADRRAAIKAQGINGNDMGMPLGIAVRLQWGKYAPAIARWENATRPAPAPTEPNKNGNPRLSAAFSEWLMGWPAGWVTDVPGISRNDALRIVGNGVVPQQCEAALRYLLSVACEVVA